MTENSSAAVYKVTVNGKSFMVSIDDDNAIDIKTMDANSASGAAPEVSKAVTPVCAPLPATVVQILVSQGQAVQEGDTLMVVSVMKMESHIVAPVAGSVQSIAVQVQEQVEVDQVLLTLA